MEGGGGRAGVFEQWGRTACDTRCQGPEETQLCSPPRVAAGMGRESPGAELGVPHTRTCLGIWEGGSFSWVILATVAVCKLCWETQEKQ